MRFALNISPQGQGMTGFYELNTFPGCNQMVVLNHVLVYPDKRGSGFGTRANQIQVQQAKILGYDYIICTVISTNLAQLRIVMKNGFKELDSFDNIETGNTVKIFGKKLLK